MMKPREYGIKELEVRPYDHPAYREDDITRYQMIADKRAMALVLKALSPYIKSTITRMRKANDDFNYSTNRELADMVLRGEMGSEDAKDQFWLYQEILDATDLHDEAQIRLNDR